MAEVAGRLSDTAEKLDEHGRRSRELADEGLEEIRRQQRWFEEMDQRSEARLVSQEAGRTARLVSQEARRTARLVSREARRSEREHAQATRQDKLAAAAAKEVRRTLLELLQMSDRNSLLLGWFVVNGLRESDVLSKLSVPVTLFI